MKKNSFLNTILIYFASSIFAAISGFISIKIFSLYLSPIDFGIYSIVYGIYSIILSILFASIGQASIRFYYQYKKSNRLVDYYTNILTITILLSIILIIIAIALFLLNFNSNNLYYKLIVAFIVLMAIQGVYVVLTGIARSKEKALVQMISDTVFNVLKIIFFILIFFYANSSSEAIVYASIISFSISFVILVSVIPRNHFKLSSINKKIIKQILSYSIPLSLLPIVNWVLSSSDVVMIKLFLSEYEAGIYSMGYRIGSNIFFIFSGVLMVGLYPRLTKLYNDNPKQTEIVIKDFSIVYFIIVMPIFTIILKYSNELIRLFSSETYIQSKNTLIIASIGFILLGYASYTNKPWELTMKTKQILYNTLVTAIVNIVLNIIFIPIFGFEAAAITTAFSYFLLVLISLVQSRKFMKISIKINDVLNLFFPNIILFFILVLFDFNTLIYDEITKMIAGVVFGGLVYVLLIVLKFKKIIRSFLNI